MRWLTFLVIALLLTPDAYGQNLEPTDRESRLNAEALRHLEAEEYDAAITSLKEAVAERRLNILWLNLGRVYQRAGRCQEAIEAYTEALGAPAVVDPPRAEVRELATEYMNELLDQCPAQVTVECAPETVVTARRERDGLVVGNIECGATREWEGGTWVFTATRDGNEKTETLDVRAARDYEVELIIKVPEPEPEPEPASSAPQTPSAETNVVVSQKRSKKRRLVNGSVLVAAGFVTMATAAYLDGLLYPGFPPTSDNQRLDPFDWVPAGAYLLGGGLMTVGIVILWP